MKEVTGPRTPSGTLWSESCSVLSDSMWPHGLYSPWNSLGQNIGVDGCSLLQGIFPTQGSNPGPPHCRWILNQLSHQGSPRILEWVAYSFSSGSSWPKNPTGVSCIAGRFFTNWTIRDFISYQKIKKKKSHNKGHTFPGIGRGGGLVLSHVQLLRPPWTVTCQPPLSMGIL